MDKLTEALGFALVIAFGYFVWPPLPLLLGGVLLVVYANTRQSTGRIARAWWAARKAYAGREVEHDAGVRRIA